MEGRIILKAGEIYKAPYFILDVTYDSLSLMGRVTQLFLIRRRGDDSQKHLVETINGLRENIKARNRAYHSLKIANEELLETKKRLEEYSLTLEQKVDERTAELRKAKEKLVILNRGLEDKVREQVDALRRYDDLRRYLSPKLAERILSCLLYTSDAADE